MKKIKLIFAVIAALALLTAPEIALNAAREAMRTWATSVAPALLPFLLLLPLLTGPEAGAAYESLMGRFLRPLLGLPGAAAPAIVVGMIGGSPAGAVAARNAGLSPRDTERIVGCVGGLSPAFLISGVGAAMLGSAADGRLLMRSQLIAQLILLLLSRRKYEENQNVPVQIELNLDPVRNAVLTALGVCGYMTAFRVLAALLTAFVGSEKCGIAALCLLDLPSGAQIMASIKMNRELRLLLISAMTGFGGLCIALQNFSQCRERGVRLSAVLLFRAVSAVLMSCITTLQLQFQRPTGKFFPNPMEISALTATIFAVPTWIFLRDSSFLNKRKSGKIPPVSVLKQPKTTKYCVLKE